MKTEEQIDESAIKLLEGLYPEYFRIDLKSKYPASRVIDIPDLLELIKIAISDTQKELIESASDGFKSWEKNEFMMTRDYGQYTYHDMEKSWQASRLSLAKENLPKAPDTCKTSEDKLETIKHAAVKSDDGKWLIFGKSHAECIWKGSNIGVKLSSKDENQGFITNFGAFVSRSLAATIAFNAGMIDQPKKRLYSEDLWSPTDNGKYEHDEIKGYYLRWVELNEN